VMRCQADCSTSTSSIVFDSGLRTSAPPHRDNRLRPSMLVNNRRYVPHRAIFRHKSRYCQLGTAIALSGLFDPSLALSMPSFLFSELNAFASSETVTFSGGLGGYQLSLPAPAPALAGSGIRCQDLTDTNTLQLRQTFNTCLSTTSLPTINFPRPVYQFIFYVSRSFSLADRNIQHRE